MPWFIGEGRLDSFQTRVLSWLIGKRATTSWVQGYAGTGKTILMVHAMEKILAANPKARLAFISYTHALKDLVSEGMPPSLRKKILITTKDDFKTLKESFDHVFVDEVQDVPKAELKQIREKTKSLTIAGDADQRIWPNGADADEIADELSPEIQRLTAMHRLTPAIKNLAMKIMPKAKLVEGKAVSGVRSVTIRMVKFDQGADEAPWMFNEALERASPGEPSVLLISTHLQIGLFARELAASRDLPLPPAVNKSRSPSTGRPGKDYSEFNEYFASHGIPLAFFGSGNNEYKQSNDKAMVYIVTFHSSKGLDFRQVFIPYCTPKLFLGNKADVENDVDLGRRTLFVQVTRSRQDLFMSYNGDQQLHEYLRVLPDDVTKLSVAAGWKPSNESGTFF